MCDLAQVENPQDCFDVQEDEDELYYRSYRNFPQIRYMGSKYKLLPWIEQILSKYDFESVFDAFSGSGAVSYMLKCLGHEVCSNDFLHFSYLLSRAFIENSYEIVQKSDIDLLLKENENANTFIKDTFENIFFQREDLEFLDNISSNICLLENEYKKSLVYAALFRSCIKKQPRGVFTISGALDKYDDGRRDLKLSIKDHFIEQISIYNGVVFSNGKHNTSINKDVFLIDSAEIQPDLVYLDPPYVPRSDDNCYVKRYHFLEGLSDYWANEEILQNTKVKKIKKRYTPFSYKKTAEDAFSTMFDKFKNSKIALSYSSNAFPDLDKLVEMMEKVKSRVEVYKKEHRYHFGTHPAVKRAVVDEYLIVGI